ncbi:hypothetical protein ACEQPO_19490 [Bacillus sp. SL00103]
MNGKKSKELATLNSRLKCAICWAERLQEGRQILSSSREMGDIKALRAH